MEARLSAFVLGNSNYKNKRSFPPLPHCRRDAEEIFSVVTEPPTGIFDKSTSMSRFDLSHNHLLKELSKFFAAIKKHDTVLIYFACHGRKFGKNHFALAMTDTQENNLAGTAFDVALLATYLA